MLHCRLAAHVTNARKNAAYMREKGLGLGTKLLLVEPKGAGGRGPTAHTLPSLLRRPRAIGGHQDEGREGVQLREDVARNQREDEERASIRLRIARYRDPPRRDDTVG